MFKPWLHWLVLSLTGVWLLVSYGNLPSQVPLMGDVTTGSWLLVADKSLVAVFRVPIMSMGQLAAAQTMESAARREGALCWARFWGSLAAVAVVKGGVGVLQLSALGMELSLDPFVVLWALRLFVVTVIGLALWRLWLERDRLVAYRLGRLSFLKLGAAMAVWAFASLVPIAMAL